MQISSLICFSQERSFWEVLKLLSGNEMDTVAGYLEVIQCRYNYRFFRVQMSFKTTELLNLTGS